MNRVLLFTHPGGERVPTTFHPTVCEWNTTAHSRKFLIVPASVATRVGRAYEASREREEVAVWAEWEPPSTVTRFHEPAPAGYPRAWHRPLSTHLHIREGSPPRHAQNTDPWIFGEQIRYSNCRQQGWSVLRQLDHGDVVFFGSVLKRDQQGLAVPRFNFFLDTVFVVGSSQSYSVPYGRSHRLPVDSRFERLVLERLRGRFTHPFVLYEGQTLRGRQTEMFSWVPCVPVRDNDPAAARFSRPMINDLLGLSDVGNSGRWKGQVVDIDARLAWDRVAKRCKLLGLSMATQLLLEPEH